MCEASHNIIMEELIWWAPLGSSPPSCNNTPDKRLQAIWRPARNCTRVSREACLLLSSLRQRIGLNKRVFNAPKRRKTLCVFPPCWAESDNGDNAGVLPRSRSLPGLRRRSVSLGLLRHKPGTAMQINPTGDHHQQVLPGPPTVKWRQSRRGENDVIMCGIIMSPVILGQNLSAGSTKEADLGDQRRPCLS